MDSPSKFSHLSTDLCLGFFGSGLCLQSVSWKRRSEFRAPGVSRLQALAISKTIADFFFVVVGGGTGTHPDDIPITNSTKR